jgi:hypothetical protein
VRAADSVFLVVDSDADDLATFASALTSRYASEFDIRSAATASEAHATLAALSVAGITVALLIVSRDLGTQDRPRRDALNFSVADGEITCELQPCGDGDLADAHPKGVVRGTMRRSGTSVKIPFLDRLPLFTRAWNRQQRGPRRGVLQAGPRGPAERFRSCSKSFVKRTNPPPEAEDLGPR